MSLHGVLRALRITRGMSIARIEAALAAFFAEHATETFCAIAIDAGLVYINSDEGFERSRAKYSADWEIETAPVSLAEARACDPDKLSRTYATLAYQVEKGESIEQGLEAENRSRAQKRGEGNPYELIGSDAWRELRWGTGSFEYPEVVNLDLDDEAQAHYENDQPASSRYAKLVAAIVAGLKARQGKLLAGVKLSKDFRIYAVDHEL